MGFTSSTVSIGASTKKSDYDNLLNNTQWNKGRLDIVYDGVNTFAGNKTFSGTVSIEGATTLGDGLAVSGESTFQSATTFSSSISIDGASRVRVTKNNAQSIARASAVIVQFDDEVFDNLGEFANYKFTAKQSGYYFVSASLESAPNIWLEGQIWKIRLYKNDSHVSTGSYNQIATTIDSNPFISQITDIIYLAATDYIDIRCYQTDEGAINTSTGAAENYFSVHRIS